jgi:hypothetical protein
MQDRLLAILTYNMVLTCFGTILAFCFLAGIFDCLYCIYEADFAES